VFEATTETTADRARAWDALIDVSSWPQWTRSMTEVCRLDNGALGVGSAARIKQPGMPPMVWRVTELREGASFSWATRLPGVRTVGHHRLDIAPSGRVRITVGIEQHGPLAGLVRVLSGQRIRRYLRMEVDGLKAAAEQAPVEGG
jgi:hypothetical protein